MYVCMYVCVHIYIYIYIYQYSFSSSYNINSQQFKVRGANPRSILTETSEGPLKVQIAQRFDSAFQDNNMIYGIT